VASESDGEWITLERDKEDEFMRAAGILFDVIITS
jgi:hypothetical protein